MGKVYLVGAGPGDPELLTLKAARLIAAAGVIVYDRLVSAEVLTLARPNAKLIFAGKRQGEQETIQAEIYRLLQKHSVEVETVVRLKGGDPMVFGRGAEEWLHLRARGIDVEVVPGISASLAVPALAGIPLTCRGVAASFAVIAGHRQSLRKTDWKQYRHIDTLVVLMGVSNRRTIAESLIQAGRPASEPVAFITRGSTERERVVVTTLSAVGRVIVDPPAIFVIGEVVRLRDRLIRSAPEAAAVAVAMEEAALAG